MLIVSCFSLGLLVAVVVLMLLLSARLFPGWGSRRRSGLVVGLLFSWRSVCWSLAAAPRTSRRGGRARGLAVVLAFFMFGDVFCALVCLSWGDVCRGCPFDAWDHAVIVLGLVRAVFVLVLHSSSGVGGGSNVCVDAGLPLLRPFLCLFFLVRLCCAAASLSTSFFCSPSFSRRR